MIKTVHAVLAILCMLTCSVAQAQESLPNRLLPEYTPCVVQDTRYACYTLDQQQALNLLEVNARYWFTQWHLVDQLRLQLTDLVPNLEAQIHELHDINTENDRYVRTLTEQLQTEIEAKNRYRAQAENIDWWPLIVGGVLALLGIGVGTGVILDAYLN